MSYCPNCGSKLPDGAKFCVICGTPAIRNIPSPGNGAANSSQPYPTGRASSASPGTPAARTAPPPVTPAARSAPPPVAHTAPPPAPPAAPSNPHPVTGSLVNTSGRLVKGLICVPIAAALVLGIVIFFEIDLSNMDQYVSIVTAKIYELGMFESAAPQLAAIAVYGLAAMIVLSAYMLPARLTKAIYKTCSVADKLRITLAGYFVIALSLYLKISVLDTGIVGNSFSLLFKVHGTDRLKALFAVLILLVCIIVALAFIIGSAGLLISVVVNNLAVNGPVLGIIAAAYELLSSVFVTALVLCAFSFGVAIILMPFLILAACSSGQRVVYDRDGNMYYVV